MQYFTDGYPTEKRADAKVFDAGAGTGMVARGVGISFDLKISLKLAKFVKSPSIS